MQAFIIRPRRKWCLHTRAAPWIFKNLNPFGLEHRAAEFVIFFIPMVLFDVAGTVILARLYPEDDYSVAALFGVFTTGVIWHMKNYYLFLRTGVVASAGTKCLFGKKQADLGQPISSGCSQHAMYPATRQTQVLSAACSLLRFPLPSSVGERCLYEQWILKWILRVYVKRYGDTLEF